MASSISPSNDPILTCNKMDAAPVIGIEANTTRNVFLTPRIEISRDFTRAGYAFLAYGTRISASTSGAGKCHLTPPM